MKWHCANFLLPYNTFQTHSQQMRQNPNKDKGGRPKVVLTQKQIEEVGELSQRLTIEQIADYLGIGQTTFYELQKRQPEVSVAYKKGKQKAVNWVTSKLMEKIADGDTASTLFFLKTQAGWSEKQYLDVTSNTPTTLQPIILSINRHPVTVDPFFWQLVPFLFL